MADKRDKSKKLKPDLPAGTKVCPWGSCLLFLSDNDAKGHMQVCPVYMRITCNFCSKRCIKGNEEEMRLHVLKRHPHQAKFLSTVIGQTGFSVDERLAADMLHDAIRRCFVATTALPAPVDCTFRKEAAATSDNAAGKDDDVVHIDTNDDLREEGEEEEGELSDVAESENIELPPVESALPSTRSLSVLPPSDLQLWQMLAEERRLRAESLQETVAVQRQLLEVLRANVPQMMKDEKDATTSRHPPIRLGSASKAVTPLVSGEASGSTTDTPVAGVVGQCVKKVLDSMQSSSPLSGLYSGRRGGVGRGRGRGGPRCHACGGLGHVAADCANKRQ
jgi:hypothetical protein